MRFLFLVLCALLISAVFGWFLENNNGDIVFVTEHHVVNIKLSLFVIAGLLLFIVGYCVLRVISRIIHLPEEVSRARTRRRLRIAELSLVKGLECMVRGEWQRAEKLFRTAAHSSATPQMSYLLAARAANQRNESKASEEYFASAMQMHDGENLLAELTQAELLLSRGEQKRALSTLSRLHERQPKQAMVQRMLLDAHSRQGNWRAMLALSKTAEQKAQAWMGLLSEAGDRGSRAALDELWREIPAKIKKIRGVIGCYVNQCLRMGDAGGDCEELLYEALKRDWDSALIRAYGLIQGVKPERQLKRLEGFLKQRHGDPDLLLALGRLAVRNELWGKAKTYLENSVAAHPTTDACLAFAKFFEREGDSSRAGAMYKKALALTMKEPWQQSLIPDSVEQDKQEDGNRID
ncbi:MAG: heme biosynthesis HemY N-terminal domain-containing protein [Candidatus Eutrophobiaceae bacterium]